MTEYIVLGRHEILSLKTNRPVFVYIDGELYTLCTNEYFEKQMRDSQAESEEK